MVRKLKGYQEVLVIVGIFVWTVVVGYFISGLDIATDFYTNKTLETWIIYIDACSATIKIQSAATVTSLIQLMVILNGVNILENTRKQTKNYLYSN